MRRALAERFSRGVQINYFLQARDSDRPSSLRDVGNEDEVIQRKLGIALVIFSTDFRPFDDSTSFYTVRVFRHSPRTTPVGYLRLPERRIGTRTTGCARLIRESKLSCIIHYTPSLFLSVSRLRSPATFWIGNFWNSLCRFWRGNLSRLWYSHYEEKSMMFGATNVQDPENALPWTVKRIWCSNIIVMHI